MDTTGAIDDAALVRAARRGDRAAFGGLVRAYQRRAYASAYAVVGNREDAWDAAQEAFVRAFRAMHRFDPAQPFFPWLHTIVRNTALNLVRKRRRRGETSLDAMVEKGYDAHDAGPGTGRGAELGELQRAIAEALPGLSAEHREILHLRHFAEMSYEEIAQCLDVPVGTVMSRLHAARKRLRAVLACDYPELTAVARGDRKGPHHEPAR